MALLRRTDSLFLVTRGRGKYMALDASVTGPPESVHSKGPSAGVLRANRSKGKIYSLIKGQGGPAQALEHVLSQKGCRWGCSMGFLSAGRGRGGDLGAAAQLTAGD